MRNQRVYRPLIDKSPYLLPAKFTPAFPNSTRPKGFPKTLVQSKQRMINQTVFHCSNYHPLSISLSNPRTKPTHFSPIFESFEKATNNRFVNPPSTVPQIDPMSLSVHMRYNNETKLQSHQIPSMLSSIDPIDEIKNCTPRLQKKKKEEEERKKTLSNRKI